MITARIDKTELHKGGSDVNPDVAFEFGLVVSAADGSASSQVISVALEPGKSGGRHAHSAEEILLVLEGFDRRCGIQAEPPPACESG
jgi:quercetin dioxygenase-like cupin family protein